MRKFLLVVILICGHLHAMHHDQKIKRRLSEPKNLYSLAENNQIIQSEFVEEELISYSSPDTLSQAIFYSLPNEPFFIDLLADANEPTPNSACSALSDETKSEYKMMYSENILNEKEILKLIEKTRPLSINSHPKYTDEEIFDMDISYGSRSSSPKYTSFEQYNPFNYYEKPTYNKDENYPASTSSEEKKLQKRKSSLDLYYEAHEKDKELNKRNRKH